MSDIKVGDTVYGDPKCKTLESIYHNVEMKVISIGESISPNEEKSRILSVSSLNFRVPASFTIMEFAVKTSENLDIAGRGSKAEKEYYERVGYWDTYFNGLEPLRVP